MTPAVAERYLDKEGVCRNLIGGEWVQVDSGEVFEDTNPADTRQVLARFPKANRETVKAAIDAAGEAQKKWAEVPPPERARVLFKAAEILDAEKDEYAKLLTTEEGKTLAESAGEITRTLGVLRFFSGSGYRMYGQVIPSDDPKVQIYTRREPLGVVSIITPWNFPILLASWKIAPALVAGNGVVFKPASYTPLMGMRLASLFERSGLPKGVLNFVTGSGEAVGDEMVRNPNVAAVSFTGSNTVGQSIQSVASSRKTLNILRVQLEMGGKNPTLVMDDAELDNAANIVVRAAFGVTGQSCSATERVIVHDRVYDSFLRKLVDKASRLRIGNGLEGADMGPLVSMTERKKVLGYFEAGKGEGAQIAYGGGVPAGEQYAHGAYVQPTIFTDVSANMSVAQEEIFGPVVAMFRFSNLDEGIEIANSVEYGLLSSICTNNLSVIQEFVKKIKAGVVRVNRPTTGIEPQAPFGGMKKSGTNTYRENGDQAIEFYTQMKTVYLGA